MQHSAGPRPLSGDALLAAGVPDTGGRILSEYLGEIPEGADAAKTLLLACLLLGGLPASALSQSRPVRIVLPVPSVWVSQEAAGWPSIRSRTASSPEYSPALTPPAAWLRSSARPRRRRDHVRRHFRVQYDHGVARPISDHCDRHGAQHDHDPARRHGGVGACRRQPVQQTPVAAAHLSSAKSLAGALNSGYDMAIRHARPAPAPPLAGALAFLLATAFIAALARGFSGFGAALIFLPLAATVVDPKIASPLLLITDAVLAVGSSRPPCASPTSARSASWASAPRSAFRSARSCWCAPIRGHPLGHRGARDRDARAADLRLALSRHADRTAHLRRRRLRGRVRGAAQVGGPAVIAYWLGSHSPAAIIRANIILYFAISTAIAIVALLRSAA